MFQLDPLASPWSCAKHNTIVLLCRANAFCAPLFHPEADWYCMRSNVRNLSHTAREGESCAVVGVDLAAVAAIAMGNAFCRCCCCCFGLHTRGGRNTQLWHRLYDTNVNINNNNYHSNSNTTNNYSAVQSLSSLPKANGNRRQRSRLLLVNYQTYYNADFPLAKQKEREQ